ncbi:putative signal transducing protein [Neorhodopirellula pilleata]|nr:DUF2007 domain-containing protein [Neorhodopirellula pilleata]
MNRPPSNESPTDPNAENLEVVAERSTEVAASVLVNVLADEGIRAVAVGGFTAGFRAEAPGWVQVKTFERDAERARQIIAELKKIG